LLHCLSRHNTRFAPYYCKEVATYRASGRVSAAIGLAHHLCKPVQRSRFVLIARSRYHKVFLLFEDQTVNGITAVSQLRAIFPQSADILHVLLQRGILDAPSFEPAITCGASLFHLATQPRAQGLENASVYWTVLERLFNPATNTQLLNVPLADGAEGSSTCAAAARIYILIARTPGEFTRIVAELTGPDIRFASTRVIQDAKFLQAKMRWLQNRFDYQLIGNDILRVYVRPDKNALSRAVFEEEHRRFAGYDFGQWQQKNTRSAVDVLLESAMMNYAMEGSYDSHTDSNWRDGTKGLSPDTLGYMLMDIDILWRGSTVAIPLVPIK
jgi:hypothetical protein